jgi:hypothetical protein
MLLVSSSYATAHIITLVKLRIEERERGEERKKDLCSSFLFDI